MTKHVKNSKVNKLSLNDPKRCSISNVHRPVTSLWINRDFVVVVVVGGGGAALFSALGLTGELNERP